jgi:glycosyltransferase involved in cell wall biosynthesis
VDATVIVPCRNPGPDLRMLLASLARQDASFPWELLVVDNGTTDGSLRSVRNFEDRLPVRVVPGPAQPGSARTRNVGAERASSEKLLFIDADDEVAPNYVGRLGKALDDHELVTSRVDSQTLNELPIHRALALGDWQQSGVDTFFHYLPATGCNIGIRRETFRRLGAFPTEFPRAVDIAFTWRANLSGVEIHFVPDTTYFYRHRRSVRALYRQHREWATAHPLLYKRFREAGMPGRPPGQLGRELGDLFRDLVRARSKVDLETCLVRAATYVGRVQGSVRHRMLYV